MGNFIFFLLINIISQIMSSINDINNNLNSSLFINYNNNSFFSIEQNKDNNINIRKLDNDDDSFRNIRIFIDKTYINKQMQENFEILNKIISSIEKCVESLQIIIKVRQLDKIKLTNEDILLLGFNNSDINSNLLPNGEGITSDLIIFPKFVNFQPTTNLVLAIGKPVLFDSITNRPICGILNINRNIPSIRNTQSYLDSVIIHQLTHILGFMYDLFNRFETGINNVVKTDIETRTNQTKKFIISPKVVAYAKKYFNCSSITGVELEDLGGYDNYSHSHWEARILLGEYMNSEVYTPEQAISGFTLALLEDSGWYKANYYTGGLMRFGKHQGCSFLNEDCEVNNKEKNMFKNDIFTVENTNDFYQISCSSGRQSRGYIVPQEKINRRVENLRMSGKEITDECFVSDTREKEEKTSYYVGSCNKGNGNYGEMIFPGSLTNGDMPENFGEKISNNSFCVLSSATPLSLKEIDINKYNMYKEVIHPMCYPMYCSSQFLTIQIYNQYIVCPRQGGIVEIKGNYIGYIYCPDYNLICTGEVICNDIFDCIEKKSSEKINTYEYDYSIKTSQELIISQSLTENDIDIAFELANEENTKCPQYCSQCKENKKCFICKENYLLIGEREGDDNPIYCLKNSNLDNYYKKEEDNTYYKCSENCLFCTGKDICNKCDELYKLKKDNSGCEEIIPGCKIIDPNNHKCKECKDNYYFIDEDNYHCYNDTIDSDKYFTEDNGKNYYSCNKVIENCDKCNGRNECLFCNEGYIFNQFNITCSLEIQGCYKYEINYEYCLQCIDGYYLLDNDKFKCHNDTLDPEKYFTEDEGITYISCGKAINNCEKCENKNSCLLCKDGYTYNSKNSKCEVIISFCKIYDDNYEYCLKCEEGYYLLNDDKFNCYNDILDPEKYFTEDEGVTYISCNKSINNCEKCENRNICLSCFEGYKYISEKIICEEIISFCKTYDEKYERCLKCDEGYYLLNDNKLKCYNDTLDPEKYITEDEGITFINCGKIINNCEKCDNKNYCNQCESPYKISIDRSQCFLNKSCNLNIYQVDSEGKGYLSEENIRILVENYRLKYNENLGQVEHYANFEHNFSITIFRIDDCTNDLLNIGAFSLNTTEILESFNEKDLIICFITYNYKNYINFYQNNKNLDIPSNSNLNYNLKNNFTNLLKKNYSPLLMQKILEENIDIFSTKNEKLDDICNPFEIGGINIPVEIREKIFFNEHTKEEFLCTDLNCEINSNDIEISLSNCDCKINNDFNYLLSEKERLGKNINFISNQEKISPIDYITCIFKNNNNQKIFNKFSLFLSIFCIFIEIICLIVFLSLKNIINISKYIKNNFSNLNRQETQENKNILNTEDLPKPASSNRNFKNNPPKKILIKYKYKWLKKPCILNLNNSHDEDLEIQSRDEANNENGDRRKIKIFPFTDDKSVSASSYLDESLFDSDDKKTETSKNKNTIPVLEDKLKIKTNPIISSPQNIKKNILPQIISREQNARRKVKIHSIKNETTKENIINSVKINEKNIIKTPLKIYSDVICIKQHLISLFSFFFNDIDKISFIPLPMKIIRVIFTLIVNLFLNSILLSSDYFSEKYYYFNNIYYLAYNAEKNFKLSSSDNIIYSLNHCIKNALISFFICLLLQLIIGLLFYDTKKIIDNFIELSKNNQEKNDNNNIIKRIKCKFLFFFIINFIFLIIFCLFLIGFNMINDKSEIDFLVPSIISIILLQIIPFLISIILTLMIYFGLKNGNKKLYNFAKSFLF